MRVLITRPREDAATLAQLLAAKGIDSDTASMLLIEAIGGVALSVEDAQAILLTSANGARALAAATTARDRPVFAVGDATARAAATAGFAEVESAAGDVEALADLVIGRLDPARGPLVHVAARDVAGELAGTLEAAGFTLRRAVLYRAVPAERLAESIRSRLAGGDYDGVLFFSPRTARSFVSLVRAAGHAAALAETTAFCLSRAVADAAEPARWGRIAVAAEPTQAALIRLVDRAATDTE